MSEWLWEGNEGINYGCQWSQMREVDWGYRIFKESYDVWCNVSQGKYENDFDIHKRNIPKIGLMHST